MKTKPLFLSFEKYGVLGALGLALLSGCGGGGGASTNLPGPAPATSSEAQSVARWKPVVSADVGDVAAPPFSGSPSEQREIETLLALQNARTPAQIALFEKWNGQTATRWNEIARSLVISHNTVPPLASRVYAALSVAQFDAAIAASRQKVKVNRAAPALADGRLQPLGAAREGDFPSQSAAMCAASAGVLKSLYPDSAALLDKQASYCRASRLIGGVNFPSDLEAGERIGAGVAAQVLQRLASDGADKATAPRPKPSGPGIWTGEDGLLPSWGRVTPWLVRDIGAVRAPAPPVFGSAQFNAELAEVRDYSDNRTPETARIAEFWADAAQTFTPPGHWNLFAVEICASHNLSDAQSARVYALLNMAMQDAGIVCWYDKFDYGVIRPSQADPKIETPVGLPNFPAYTSGHSTFSGAAAQTLGALFPDQKTVVDALAQEASVSRIYGGIHYRFDAVEGLKSGRRVAGLAIARAQNDGASNATPTGTTLSFEQLKQITQAELSRRAPGGQNAKNNWD